MTEDQMKLMSINEKVEVIRGKAYIRRKSRDSFALVVNDIKSRCRFGTAREIIDDLERFESTGYLPEGKSFF